MTRFMFLLVLYAAGCGDDSTDEGKPNGKPCTRDDECASEFCRPDDQNGPICATPGGENEQGPETTGGATSTDPSSSEG